MRQHRQKIHTRLNWTAVFRVSSLFHDFLSSSSAPPFITFHHFDSLWYKCGVADAQKQKKSCALPELLTNVVLDGGTGRLCSNTTWRSVMGGAYIPRWWPVIGQDHFCLHVIPPMGPQQGLMGITLSWTCFWQFAALFVEVVLLIPLLVSSYRYPVWTDSRKTL